MERIGDTRGGYSELLGIYWPIGVAVYVIVLGLVLFVVLRFSSRRREFPRGTDERRRAEILYATFVACVAALLLYVTYEAMSDIEASEREADGPLIEVTAAKWNWRFDYPEAGVSQVGGDRRPATLVVPSGTPVRFRLTSIDVIHAFWVPDLRFKRDAFPQRTTTFVLSFPDEGFQERAGSCAQFCGLLHATMEFNVNVLGEEEFRRWTRDKRAEVSAP